MRRTTRIEIVVLLATAVATTWASTASAQGATEIGGKVSVTGNLSVVTTDPDGFDDTTAVILGALGAYTTESGRFEFGGGFSILGIFTSFDASAYDLTAQARINSNPLGPEENVLLYAGAVAGLGIVRIDIDGGDSEVGVFGPKLGAEFYITPRTAIQIEDTVLGDTDGGVSNNLTVGFKLIFN